MPEGNLQKRLADYCLTLFPSRLGLQVISMEQLNDGWECEVYSVSLRWQESGVRQQQLVLRLYTVGNDEPLIRNKHEREFEVMRGLHGMGYPVPEVIAVDTGKSLGQPAILMEKIVGAPLSRALSLGDLNATQPLLDQFAELAIRLHRLDWRPFAAVLGVDSTTDPIQHQLTMLTEYLRLTQTDGFGLAMVWLNKRAEQVRSVRPALIHLDYHLDNVLLRDRDQQPLVIDWTAADITDYRFDLAWSRVLMGDGLGERFLITYRRLSECSLPDFDFFLAFACVRRLFVMFVAIRQGTNRLGMRPGAEKAIRQNGRHLRAVYQELQALSGLRLPLIEQLIEEL